MPATGFANFRIINAVPCDIKLKGTNLKKDADLKYQSVGFLLSFQPVDVCAPKLLACSSWNVLQAIQGFYYNLHGIITLDQLKFSILYFICHDSGDFPSLSTLPIDLYFNNRANIVWKS